MCAILVDCIKRKCSVGLFWSCGSGGDVVNDMYFYLELWRPFCSVKRKHLYNLVEGIFRNSSVIFSKFGLVVQEEMSLKNIYYL